MEKMPRILILFFKKVPASKPSCMINVPVYQHEFLRASFFVIRFTYLWTCMCIYISGRRAFTAYRFCSENLPNKVEIIQLSHMTNIAWNYLFHFISFFLFIVNNGSFQKGKTNNLTFAQGA